MSDFAIQTKDLVKKFGKFTAVDKINLEITTGSIHGFVGPNGAGKSTTMKMLIGAMLPTSGSGVIGNFEIGSKASRKLIGYAPERPSFYKDMTALEFLNYMGNLSGLPNIDCVNRAYELLNTFELLPFINAYPHTFSSGMKKKLIIAQALMHQPKILILDEPTANLDPETRMLIMKVLKDLVKNRNMTVFISSHILTELELIIDSVSLIDKGKLVLSGKLKEIKNRFSQGVFEINTDNNGLLKEHLLKTALIDDCKLMENCLKVYTKEINMFKKNISRIISNLDLMINSFNEEKITLDSVYQHVFSKVREGDGDDHLSE